MASSATSKQGGRIDTHHHFILPSVVAELEKKPTKFWVPKSLDDHIAYMDKNDIATAILSTADSLLEDVSEEKTVDLCQKSLQHQEDAIVKYPGRFGIFAALPLPYIERTVQYLQETKDRTIDGYFITTSQNKHYIGDPIFDPILKFFEERHAVVFAHPTESEMPPHLKIPEFVLEFPAETARTIVHMLMMGTFTRYPNIKWIFAHNGGSYPFIAHRTSPLHPLIAKANNGKSPREIFEQGNIYFDTAISHPKQWSMIRELGLPANRILIGTDFPMTMIDESINRFGLHSCAASEVFNKEELEQIARGNGLELFPRLKNESK